MVSQQFLTGRILPVAQVLLGIVAIAVVVSAPPPRGRMLAVPLGTAGQGDAVRIALDHGARLIASGPLARSIVVEGDRAALAGPLLASGIGLVSATAAGCGSGALS